MVLIGLAGVVGCRDVKDPEFKRVEKFGVRKLNLDAATIGFNVTYFNPNSFGVTVKEAAVDVYLDTVYLGKFNQESEVGVSKNADFSVPFSGQIPLSMARKFNWQDFVKKDILLKADGNVKVGKAGIFISKPIHYQGMHRLDEIKF